MMILTCVKSPGSLLMCIICKRKLCGGSEQQRAVCVCRVCVLNIIKIPEKVSKKKHTSKLLQNLLFIFTSFYLNVTQPVKSHMKDYVITGCNS